MESVIKARSEFLGQFTQRIQAVLSSFGLTVSRAHCLSLAEKVLCPNGEPVIPDSIVQSIDRGAFHIDCIVAAIDAELSVSKRQFHRALAIANTALLPECMDEDRLRVSTFEQALRLATLPDAWFWCPDATQCVLTSEGNPRDYLGDVWDVFLALKPFLLNTASELQRLLREGDKKAAKALAKKWAWLAKQDVSLATRLTTFDRKYNFANSIGDHVTILSDFTQNIALRLALDIPRITLEDNLWRVWPGQASIVFDMEAIREKLAITSSTDKESFSDSDLKTVIVKRCVDALTAAKMNQRLHRDYNLIISQVNGSPMHHHEWPSLLKPPTTHSKNRVAESRY